MFKGVKRYVRERLERKVISKSDKVDSLRKPKPARYYRCRASFVPDYLKRVNKNFSYHFLALKHDTQQQSNENNSDEFKSNRCLDPSWVETFGLSGTLAFGWSLSQNVESKRKRLVDEILDLHYNNSCPLKSVLCPYTAVKNVLPKHVLTQPNNILQTNINGNRREIPLPVFGPLTAEETLNEAKVGLEKARNAAIAEFENRMGLQCMSKKRYRRAMAHFAAGSALQNGAAMFNLAQCYELGLGTPKDLAKAAKCYHAAAEMGNATATFNLAVFYAQGLGGLKSDKVKAEELLQKAVELGEPHAKVALESRSKSQRVSGEEISGVKSTTQSDRLVTPATNKKVAPFPSMDTNKVTETSQNKFFLVTKTCTDVKFQDDTVVSAIGKTNLHNFALLGVKDYVENIRKFPVTFHEPVMPRKNAVVAFHW